MYMLGCVFEVWFKVFTAAIHLYPASTHATFVRYASALLRMFSTTVLSLLTSSIGIWGTWSSCTSN
jgi:hypothetical protein